MTRTGGDASIADLIVAMDERAALAAIRRRLDSGEAPVTLIGECAEGMERVGRLYEDGTFFISALIMAGEIFREAAEILIPLLEQPARLANAGSFVIATVKGDIHDIGKNIATTLLDAHGFHVIDLGVDVAPERVADALEHRPAGRTRPVVSADDRLRQPRRDHHSGARAYGDLVGTASDRHRWCGALAERQRQSRRRRMVHGRRQRHRGREGGAALSRPSLVSGPVYVVGSRPTDH